MGQLRIIVMTEARVAWRWARTHLYTLIFLTPLVVGMTYFSLSHWIESAPDVTLSPAFGLALAFLAACALMVVNLSRAARELYHWRQPQWLFNFLPVRSNTLLHAALANRLARTAIVGAALCAVRALLASVPPADYRTAAVLGALVVLTACAEVFIALHWIHWSHLRRASTASVGIVVLLTSAAWNALLLVLFFKPALWTLLNGNWVLSIAPLWSLLLYWFCLSCHRRWRTDDLEFAQRLQTRRRASAEFYGFNFLPAAVRAQLARDLRLTRGVFSSAVYLAGGLAVLWVAVLITVLTGDLLPAAAPVEWLELTWHPSALGVKIGAAGAAVSLAALLPVLVAHQIPRLWVERSVGTSGAELWQAKLWYARIISLPAPLLAWLAGTFSGTVPSSYVLPLLVECLWVWWIVSTLIGSLAYEMPDQPGLALILMLVIGLGLGVFVALVWPIGLALYAFGLQQMQMRGHQRATYHLSGSET